jgi:hypothetical protein
VFCFEKNVLNFFSRIFELPLPRNAEKRTKKKKKKVRAYFFLRAGALALAQMYVVFSFYFSAAPCQ